MSAEEDAKWLQWVTHQFETIAGEDGEINLQEFKRALNVKEASVHSRAGPYVHILWRKSNLVCREKLLPQVL